MLSPEDFLAWAEAGPATLALGAAFVEGLVIRALWKKINEIEKNRTCDLQKYAEDTRQREVATEGVLHRVADSMTALTEALKINAHSEDVVRRRPSRRPLVEELRDRESHD